MTRKELDNGRGEQRFALQGPWVPQLSARHGHGRQSLWSAAVPNALSQFTASVRCKQVCDAILQRSDKLKSMA